jgi:hypothetical protein
MKDFQLEIVGIRDDIDEEMSTFSPVITYNSG